MDISGGFASRRHTGYEGLPKRSQLLDSQTKQDLWRLTVQQTRGPISRLRKDKAKKNLALALALGRVVLAHWTLDTGHWTLAHHTTPRYRRVYIRCCRDVAWRGVAWTAFYD
jgi:hypothetical protein